MSQNIVLASILLNGKDTKLQATTVMIGELSVTTADLNNLNYTHVCGSTEPRSSPDSEISQQMLEMVH